jgi:hypothetical protein
MHNTCMFNINKIVFQEVNINFLGWYRKKSAYKFNSNLQI